MIASGAVGQGGGLKEVLYIVAHIGQLGLEDRLFGEMLAELAKDPWIADAGASDHDALTAGILKNANGLADRGNVTIGQDGGG